MCSKPKCSRPPAKRGMCRSHYETWRIRQHAYGRPVGDSIDADPVRRHVESLRAAGLGAERIAHLAGVSCTTVISLRRPRVGLAAPTVTMKRAVAEKLLAVPLPRHAGEVAADNDLVDATGTVRRLQALIAAGHVQRELGDRLGLRNDAVGRLMKLRQCTARTHRAVAALFGELELQVGRSDLSRRRGARHGWALPLEWDEDTIDDPAAEPVRARRGGARDRAAAQREARELAASGKDTAAIALELGVSARSVERYLAVAS